MEMSLEDKYKMRKEKKDSEPVDILHCSKYTSAQIMKVYLPKTKKPEWYPKHCIGEDGKIPDRAVNGHPGGKPFKTSDGKIMRSGNITWDELEIKPC